MPCLGTLFPKILHKIQVAKCSKWILSPLLQPKPRMRSCNPKIVRLANCNEKMRSSHLSSDTWKIAVPKCIRLTLMKEAHGGRFAGHFAERKMYATLKKKYCWNRMHADIGQHCRSCLTCTSRKGPGRSACPYLQPIPVGGRFHRVGVNVLQCPSHLVVTNTQ